MSWLQIIWKVKNISLQTKIWLMCTLVLPIFLYACETGPSLMTCKKEYRPWRLGAFWHIFQILYKDHITKNKVTHGIQTFAGPFKDLLTTVMKCKMRWYGYVSQSTSLAKTILHSTVLGTRRRVIQCKRWEDSIKEWMGLSFAESQVTAKDRMQWQTVIKKSLVPQELSTGWWDDGADDDERDNIQQNDTFINYSV